MADATKRISVGLCLWGPSCGSLVRARAARPNCEVKTGENETSDRNLKPMMESKKIRLNDLTQD